MSKIRIAVIGAEHLDPDHHLALNQLSETERVTAFALDTQSLGESRETLHAARLNDAVDAIVSAVPQSEIADWAIFAMQHDWPFYSIHPSPESIEDLIEIRRAEQKALQPVLQFGLTARLHESVVTAKSKFDTGEYGRLLTQRAVCGFPGEPEESNIALKLGVQMVDLMQIFAGPFQDVSAVTGIDHSSDSAESANVLATMRTHSGTVASLHISATQWRPTFRLELGFERGYMWLEGLASERHNFGPETLVYARLGPSGAQHETVDRFPQSSGARAAIEAFCRRVGNREHIGVGRSDDAFEALNTVQRILAADPLLNIIGERHAS